MHSIIKPGRIIENQTPRYRLAEEKDALSWDMFALSQQEVGPYHLYAWRRAVESAYGHKAYYVIAEDHGGMIQGILPLILVKPPLMKGRLLSLPFCDYGGVIAADEGVKDALYHYACSLSESLNAGLELRSRITEPGLSTESRLREFTHKVRMVFDLPENSEAVWNGFKSKLRSQIKKPQKDGFEFTIGSADLVNDFYRVFSTNMHDLGSPVHSRAWIEAVVHCYGTRAHVGVVYAGNKPVSGGIILEGNGIMAIPWASALNEYNRSSPNMLLYWGFLAYACDHGFKRFDFGRSSPGEGAYRFKEQWGAVPCPLHWYKDGITAGPVQGDAAGRIRPMIEKIWACMPQWVADTMGPMIRKFITL